MTEPLDPSKDPDRFDPLGLTVPDPEASGLGGSPEPVVLRGDETLIELLGEGAQSDPRDNLLWLWGLVGILSFLALVSLLIQLR